MKPFIIAALLGFLVFGNSKYDGGTTAAVTLVGGIVKTSHGDNVQKKYKRKDCPVCKGKGYYISGDGISKVNCGYCEEDAKKDSGAPAMTPAPAVKCEEDNCPSPVYGTPVPVQPQKQSVPKQTIPPRRILRR